MTQVELIRRHLQAGKSITPAAAMAVYGISRLASCVEDLRNTGMEIDTVLKTDEMGKQYGEYRQRRAVTVDCGVQVKPGWGIGLPTWVRKTRTARVVGTHGDASLVRFIRGEHMADHWVNNKELVNAS